MPTCPTYTYDDARSANDDACHALGELFAQLEGCRSFANEMLRYRIGREQVPDAHPKVSLLADQLAAIEKQVHDLQSELARRE